MPWGCILCRYCSNGFLSVDILAGGPVMIYYKEERTERDRKSKTRETFLHQLLTLVNFITMFGQHGFTAQEMVALSCGHRLGVARCLKSFDSTHEVDPSIDTRFVKTLAKTCNGGDKAEQPFDSSGNMFDDNYYNALQRQAGVLSSYQTLTPRQELSSTRMT
ncbi:peroxidase 47 [Tanacetum coccineum]|uniref:peroxidase n=1 Tax=Tanacetum coccineum TaxID=301880 RepID=A0ABQ5J4R5_9ASTR